MKKNNIFLGLIALILASCASFKAQYKEENQSVFPNNESIDKSFYLIGDVGLSPMNGKSDGLLALESYLKDQSISKDDHLVFLGDNIYPTGMPKKDDEFRPYAENHLNAQIEVAKQFGGQVLFIPGNHDYYNEGLDNVEREKEYIVEAMGDKDVWQPKVGCPIELREIEDDVLMLIIDSQWYLAKWDNLPTINDDCDQIKTREQFFLEIESELKKAQDKTIIVTLHHPLYTNGIHGGQYAAIKHLYPSQNNIPVPVLGSLTSLIRTSGGVSAQDRQNKRYQQMADRIATLIRASAANRVIVASGHEHTLQYIENDGVRQIVSGSGSKQGYAALSNDGLFAYGGKGFARLDVMKDGSSYVRFYSFENGTYNLLYTKQAIEPQEDFDLKSLPENYPAFAKASIYTKEQVDKSGLHESIWGNKYRDLYGTELNVQVAMLDTLMGGLTVERGGGGHQTRSLRLVAKDGREYNLRALKKSAVQFLQTTVFKEDNIASSFEDTGAEDLIFDFYTAAHPYAFLTVPTLASAIDVYHTNPVLYYVPKQPALGNYNKEYGDELYMLVERPEENHKDLESFGKPNDIESTADVFERLRRDEKYKIDEESYVRARLFDMLIGDWDRHADQWRWSEFELEDGTHLFKPIPRDRDQVYSNFDGALFATLRAMIGITNQFATYDEDINNLKWFNTAATYLDRNLSQNSGKEVWLDQAAFIQQYLTDEVIDEAFDKLPQEIKAAESTEVIKKNMRTRRDKMVKIATKYYDIISDLAILTGTDKDDFIDIEVIDKNSTRVSIYRNKDGQRADVVAQRTFYKNETDEVWVYALDDDDVITSTGSTKSRIKIRVIGGQNNDIYKMDNGKNVSIYDHKSKPNSIEKKGNARLRLTDSYDVNLYDPKKQISTAGAFTPGIGFNPDDGFRIGIQTSYIVKGFNRNPNTREHRFKAGYYFATQGYDINYNGVFAGVFNHGNLIVKGRFAGPTFAENFFGFGNETVNLDDELDFDYNRVRLSEISGGIGYSYVGEYGSNLSATFEAQGFQVERDEERFLAQSGFDNQEDFYERNWYADLSARYNYESYDVKLNPTRGMIFDLVAGVNTEFDDLEGSFGYLKPKLGFHNAISRDRKWVLKTLLQGQVNIGDDFEFFQSAQLGQNTGLRGYRLQRFSGESAMAFSGDVRYSFNEFNSGFVPLQIGVFVGGDVGRVWLDGEDSSRWHNDYGGGFYVNSAEAIGATFNLFHGADGFRFSFQVGFSF
ncbi:phosphoesterase [Nonlabens tegetincola]|uniref:metallophosphoesterase n=1 Tax=Nonlabens tegetincola TaxID=323273 RepID=UPI000A201AE9|nr:metallophosphoesterase [Nonlabens tegetincola]ARN70967.1 phosphoesterase [Nonlabens tegetincola]